MTAGLAAGTPRISRAPAAVLVVAGLTVAGAVVGVLWAWLAPPAHGVVALTKRGERAHAYLGSEGDHFFVAAVMMLGMLMVLAVVAAVLVWQWRPHRGPVMAGVLTAGLLAAAGAAAAVGRVMSGMRYPAIDYEAVPLSPDDRVQYFTEATSVFFGHTPAQMAAGLLLPAALGALVYALLAVSASRDDLGGYPPQEPPDLRRVTVTADGGQPSGR